MSPVISSTSNPSIKHIRKLVTSAKARREANQHVAEGIHLVQSFLETGATPLSCIYAESATANHEIAELLNQLQATSGLATPTTDRVFESISSVDAAVGILIVFTPTRPSNDTVSFNNSVVLLEDIQDPGNVGTILRTAAAVGLKNIILTPGCASPWSPKALRAGMGAQFGLQVFEPVDYIAVVNSAPIKTLVTALSPSSTSLYDLSLKDPVIWAFCSEGQGASKKLLDAANQEVYIPQAKSSIESLNVAAAAAVCLYEQYRQKLADR